MPLRSAYNGVDARHQLVLVERFGHIVVGAKAKTFDLVLDRGKTGEDQDWGLDFRNAQLRKTSKPDISGRLRSRRMRS